MVDVDISEYNGVAGAPSRDAAFAPPPRSVTKGECEGGMESGDAAGQQIMPFDDGSISADKAQSSAMSLVLNYSEPFFAAGAAVFGLGLFVLPMLARLNSLQKGKDPSDRRGPYSYYMHGETNTRQPLRVFTHADFKQRCGLLDPAFLMHELVMSTDQLDDHMNKVDMSVTEEEVSNIEKWRDRSNTALKSLQKRCALAFLGLPPEANEGDVSKMYKKMALELHPDKGGDPDKFQELQEMKDRLNEAEKDEKNDPEDEEEKKAKEKEKQQEEIESKKLPPDERAKKKRMDMHDNVTRIWTRAMKSQGEIGNEKSLSSNAQPALNILRNFVDRFVQNEIKNLKHDDTRGAELKFRKFVKQGAEILAVAAMHDVQTTLSTVAMNFNYRIVARSGSADIKAKCAALLDAISDVPSQAELFLKAVQNSIAEQKDRERKRKEDAAVAQRESEARGEQGGDTGSGATPSVSSKAGVYSKPAPAKAPCPSQAPRSRGSAGPADPFADFAFNDPEPPLNPQGKAAQPAAAPASDSVPRPKDVTARCDVLRKNQDLQNSTIVAAAKPKRKCWDPTFDHPYAGALKSKGTGVYCRPCQRWIDTEDFDIDVFLAHAETVHPKPPPGWSG